MGVGDGGKEEMTGTEKEKNRELAGRSIHVDVGITKK